MICKLTMAAILVGMSSVGMSAEFHVAPNGDDATGNGSKEKPWRSIVRAREYIRERKLNTNMKEDVVVLLHGGVYHISETIRFTQDDSGSDKSIIYRNFANEKPVISGGKRIAGWSKVEGKPYWQAKVNAADGFAGYFRQIYVNGVRARRAESQWFTPLSFTDDPNTPEKHDGIVIRSDILKDYKANPGDLRLYHVVEFKVDEWPVRAIRRDEEKKQTRILLDQPHFDIRYERGERYLSADQDFMVIGALEDLDEPGEWCLDRKRGVVYYYPHTFENMETSEVFAPVVETLVEIKGQPDNRVKNIRFEGLAFEYGNWAFPGECFIGGTQAQSLYSKDGKGGYAYEMPGQIVLHHTDGIQFVGNDVRRMASCGIQAFNGVHNLLVEGNVFHDLTGAALTVGRLSDERAPLKGVVVDRCTNVIFQNNVVRNTGADFLAGTGVDAKNCTGFQVLHNDISDTPYMGIHQRADTRQKVTKGIGATTYAFNRVSRGCEGKRWGAEDGAHVYTFGVWPGTEIHDNLVEYYSNHSAPPTRMLCGYYTDNESYKINFKNNVVKDVPPGGQLKGLCHPRALDNTTVLSLDNYTDSLVNTLDACVSENLTIVRDGMWPDKAQAIMAKAGLQPEYRALLRDWYTGENLARGKPVQASSNWEGMEPAKAVDGNLMTLWHTQEGGDSGHAWITVDLEKPYVIQKFYLVPRTDMDMPDHRCNFEIQVSNDKEFRDYTVIAEQNEVPVPRLSFAFENSRASCAFYRYVSNPRAFRYLRVFKTKLNFEGKSSMSMANIAVFGHEPTN